MTKNDLSHWLKSHQTTLEEIILQAAQSFEGKWSTQSNHGYDLQCSQREAYNLMNNQDLCYDRYTTPLAYSLWYQAKRINVFLSNFLDKVCEACNAGIPVQVFDLGAGTGCVQFSFGLAAVAYKRVTGKMPPIRIINVDSSPFMLSYLREYLWPSAVKHFPELNDFAVEYEVYSWSNKAQQRITHPWLCASYLFDSSDNEDYLTSNFKELIQAFDPAKILMLTSAQATKTKLMNRLSAELRTSNFQLMTGSNADIFMGDLAAVTKFRQELVRKYFLSASTKPVSWNDGSFSVIGLQKKQTGISYDTLQSLENINIFNPPLRIRREVELSQEQRSAAKFETRPSIITGAAGSGKSIVVTEKIINVLEEHQWLGPLEILVTTFNKSLLKQLRAWVTDLLQQRKKQTVQDYYSTSGIDNDGTGVLITGDLKNIRIKFLHFDMLAKHIGRINYIPFDEATHEQALLRFITETRKELGLAEDDHVEILNSSFLLEEYHRVIYGLQCKISAGEEEYQQVERTGRGKKIKVPRGIHRKVVWHTLFKYANWMHRDPIAGQSYIARRQLLYNKLHNKEVEVLYDYVFVDEFQDCTRTDFKIMMGLLKNVNNLSLAGDMAQAVHIGQSGTIPRDGEMSRRKIYRLNGSYRLPFRICEAVYPVSQYLLDASEDSSLTATITPYKGAPPGARPIVVFAKDTGSLAKKIISIKNAYDIFDVGRLTILEKDEQLCRELKQAGMTAETTTILRLKGLEKEFIIWSLQAPIEYENEYLEFAYTIMTRTNCILLIAATAESRPLYRPVLQLLRKDRIINWDRETELWFGSYIEELVTRHENF